MVCKNIFGDNMKIKFTVPLLLAIISGFLLGKVMFNQYEDKISIKPVFGEIGEDVYFIQLGVYSSKEDMEKNVVNLTSYIYEEISDSYYVYVGLTNDVKNADKLKGYFEDLGYNIYVKQLKINNSEFLKQLKQYDALLSKTDDSGAIKTICNDVLKKYEELTNVSV